jgi:hypothetical protein
LHLQRVRQNRLLGGEIKGSARVHRRTPHKNRENILYASIDAPVYAGIPLENFLTFLISKKQREVKSILYLMFDEIQYLPDWEIHLKDLVDRYPRVKFIASGSAAAALQLKSKESGAGRFDGAAMLLSSGWRPHGESKVGWRNLLESQPAAVTQPFQNCR